MNKQDIEKGIKVLKTAIRINKFICNANFFSICYYTLVALICAINHRPISKDFIIISAVNLMAYFLNVKSLERRTEVLGKLNKELEKENGVQ